jgi:hypothetical protein
VWSSAQNVVKKICLDLTTNTCTGRLL